MGWGVGWVGGERGGSGDRALRKGSKGAARTKPLRVYGTAWMCSGAKGHAGKELLSGALLPGEHRARLRRVPCPLLRWTAQHGAGRPSGTLTCRASASLLAPPAAAEEEAKLLSPAGAAGARGGVHTPRCWLVHAQRMGVLPPLHKSQQPRKAQAADAPGWCTPQPHRRSAAAQPAPPACPPSLAPPACSPHLAGAVPG